MQSELASSPFYHSTCTPPPGMQAQLEAVVQQLQVQAREHMSCWYCCNMV
jgi:hypothetical protein